jgi:hypothetical protein
MIQKRVIKTGSGHPDLVVGERIIQDFNEDEESYGDQSCDHMQGKLRERGQLLLVIPDAREHEKSRPHKDPGQTKNLLRVWSFRCRRHPLARNQRDQQNGDNKAEIEGNAPRLGDNALMMPSLIRYGYQPPASA